MLYFNIAFLVANGFIFYAMAKHIKKFQETKILLLKQNLVYIGAFANYFIWIEKEFKGQLMSSIMTSDSMVSYLKETGTSASKMTELVSEGFLSGFSVFKLKTNQCMDDIKKPLEKEIAQVLETLENQ